MISNHLLLSTATVAALLCAGPAAAQSARDSWSFEVGAATDNRSKEVSKSDGDPYAFGEAVWSNEAGFYAGPGFETIKASNGSKLELSVFGGWESEVVGYEVDLKALHKWQVDADTPSDDDSWEFTADVSRAIGPAKARLRVQHSPDSTGSTRAWTWVSGRVSWDFTPRLRGRAEIGRREQDGSVDYTGWGVGLAYAATRNLELELRWHDNDADAVGRQYESALVAGFAYAF